MLGILNALGAECRLEGEREYFGSLPLCSRDTGDAGRTDAVIRDAVRSAAGAPGAGGNQSPGGCRIGKRPVDLHIRGLTELGAVVRIEDNRIRAEAPPAGLLGAEIHLPYPSVGATENILMAAAGARGETVLAGAAREPEIGILCSFLKAMGVSVEGAGSSVIRVRGTGVPGFPLLPSRGPHCGRNISRRGSLCGWSCPSGASSGRAYGKDTLDGKTDGRAAGAGGRGHLGFHAETARPVDIETGPTRSFQRICSLS